MESAYWMTMSIMYCHQNNAVSYFMSDLITATKHSANMLFAHYTYKIEDHLWWSVESAYQMTKNQACKIISFE